MGVALSDDGSFPQDSLPVSCILEGANTNYAFCVWLILLINTSFTPPVG